MQTWLIMLAESLQCHMHSSHAPCTCHLREAHAHAPCTCTCPMHMPFERSRIHSQCDTTYAGMAPVAREQSRETATVAPLDIWVWGSGFKRSPVGDRVSGFKHSPVGDLGPGFKHSPAGDRGSGFRHSPVGDLGSGFRVQTQQVSGSWLKNARFQNTGVNISGFGYKVQRGQRDHTATS
jgi:hypothetical protein